MRHSGLLEKLRWFGTSAQKPRVGLLASRQAVMNMLVDIELPKPGAFL
jgi:hypothetical protein